MAPVRPGLRHHHQPRIFWKRLSKALVSLRPAALLREKSFLVVPLGKFTEVRSQARGHKHLQLLMNCRSVSGPVVPVLVLGVRSCFYTCALCCSAGLLQNGHTSCFDLLS